MSSSKLEESNKKSFIIYGAIHEFLFILQDCSTNKPKETLTTIARSTRGSHTRQARGRQVGPKGRRPTQAGQGQDAAVTAAWARHGVARVTRCARTRRARRRRAAAVRGGAAKQGRSGPRAARTGKRRRRRASPAVMQARSGDEAASRRREAAAGSGARRGPCRKEERAE